MKRTLPPTFSTLKTWPPPFFHWMATTPREPGPKLSNAFSMSAWPPEVNRRPQVFSMSASGRPPHGWYAFGSAVASTSMPRRRSSYVCTQWVQFAE